MKNLHIGTRLGLGFAIVLLLLVALTSLGVWRMHTANAMTTQMIEVQVKQERMVAEWVRIVEVNAARTTTAFEAVLPEKQKAVEAEMKGSSARATVLQDQLVTLLLNPRSKADLARVLEARKAYTGARKRMFDEKKAGNMEVAQDIYDRDMAGKRVLYLDSLAKLMATQHQLLDAAADQVSAQYQSGRMMLVSIGALAIMLGIACAFLITRSITVPLSEAVRVATTVESGDLTSQIDVASSDEAGQLMGALKGMNARLLSIVAEVRNGTDAIRNSSQEIASGNMDLSSRTEMQASALQQTASSMEEITTTVARNAEHTRRANELAIEASRVASKGGAVVAEVVSTMNAINESSSKIVDIISVIDGIAFQTNILALNAAVEAARAGEQGRGFAVVASEVRNLAQRSAAAAKEIKQLIGDSVARVDNGARLVDQAGSTMDEVVASIDRVTSIMADITNANDEQSAGLEQINLAVTQMDQVTQENAALVEEAAAAATSMQDQATRLSSLVDVFKLNQTGVPPAAAARRQAPRLAA